MGRPRERVVGVVNSTPLIALSIIGRLDLLPALLDEVLIPAQVYEEVVGQGRGRPGSVEVSEAEWLTVRSPQETSPFPAEVIGLDQGEIDVILLAQEVEADWVLIDEKLARQIAKAVGLRVRGTLGVLLAAYRTGILSREDSLEAVAQLAKSSVRLSDKLVRWFEGQLE
jgi:predicted nucleic acid-binding protein